MAFGKMVTTIFLKMFFLPRVKKSTPALSTYSQICSETDSLPVHENHAVWVGIHQFASRSEFSSVSLQWSKCALCSTSRNILLS